MAEVRMSLAEAAKALGLAPNGVRTRFKAGKLRGERDNSGRIWVWVDPSQKVRQKPSAEPKSNSESVTSEPDQNWLLKRLDLAETELAELRPRVAAAEAEAALLRDAVADARADRDAWRDQAQRNSPPAKRRAWFGRRA